MYREVAGDVEAGFASASEFMVDAQGIAAAAHRGSLVPVIAAADSLVAAASAAAAVYPSGVVPPGPELSALTDAGFAMNKACAETGY